MNGRALLTQLAVLTGIVTAINLALTLLTGGAMPRQVVRAIEASPLVSTVFAGNSLIAAGADTTAYEAGGGGRAINVGLGSTSPIEHDLLVRRALRLQPRRVYYGFLNLQLTRLPASTWHDLIGNRAMVFYVDPRIGLGFIAPDQPLRALHLRAVAMLPMVVERASLWVRVERLRARLRGIGVPPERVARFGRVADFEAFESLDPPSFRHATATMVATRAPLVPPVLDMLEQVRQSGAEVIVVEMPRTSRDRARFYDTPEWQAYRRYVAGELRRYGATYVVASDWMEDDAFEDGLHLKPADAQAFTARLARSSAD